MNFLQLRHQQNELRKEYKSKFNKNLMNKSHKITLSRNKIKELFKYRVIWDKKYQNDGEYEAVFYLKNEKGLFQILLPYYINDGKFDYDLKQIAIYDINGNTFSFEDENLILKPCNFNPSKQSVKDYINEYIKDNGSKR